MFHMYSVGWEEDRLPPTSQFAAPTAPVDAGTRIGPFLDDTVWVDASQGTQCLPIKVAPALDTAVVPSPEYIESLAYLKGYVQHPSQFDADEESDSATLRPATVASQASLATSSFMDFVTGLANDYVDSQEEPVAAEIMQEGVASGGSHRTVSEASADHQLLDEDERSEVRFWGDFTLDFLYRIAR